MLDTSIRDAARRIVEDLITGLPPTVAMGYGPQSVAWLLAKGRSGETPVMVQSVYPEEETTTQKFLAQLYEAAKERPVFGLVYVTPAMVRELTDADGKPLYESDRSGTILSVIIGYEVEGSRRAWVAFRSVSGTLTEWEEVNVNETVGLLPPFINKPN